MNCRMHKLIMLYTIVIFATFLIGKRSHFKKGCKNTYLNQILNSTILIRHNYTAVIIRKKSRKNTVIFF